MKDRSSSRSDGALAIVLHSHMPYVEGFGTWPFGEEWLLEAIATVYVPLIEKATGWASRGSGGVLTLGLTPVLCDQLEDSGVGDRFIRFIDGVRRPLHEADVDRFGADGEQGLAAAARASWQRYERAAELFAEWGGDLLGRFRALEADGALELWTSCATHPVLPLLATTEGARLQLESGIHAHCRRFGSWSGGFWLPECAYGAGVEEAVAASGGRAFCVNPVGSAGWTEPLEALVPIVTEAGPVAMPIDWPTVELVWSKQRGYPTHAEYLEYHSLTDNGLRIFRNGGGAYDFATAQACAAEHAREFVAAVRGRLAEHRDRHGRPGLVTCALDTELLGHWWAEGLAWLDALVDECAAQGLETVTLPAGLERIEPAPSRPLPASSWGTDRDLTTWDSPAVADFAWRARRAELQLVAALQSDPAAAGPAAERAARELLAMQASDWSFMATNELADDYPERRFAGHEAAFTEALAKLDLSNSGAALRNLAPDLQLGAVLEPESNLGAWSAGEFANQ